ncbi:MAG: magnesium chelatase subunit D [Alphaproteobacteria bacterium]|nr:magnesium chelatase subunit D [Alphaproteobacteria bacterium]
MQGGLSPDAVAAAALLAIDPIGLGGVVLRGPPDPMRDAWLALFRSLLPGGAPFRRAPASIDADRLLGGVDLAATLAAGKTIAARGLMAECDGGALVLTLADRCGAQNAAHLAAALDNGEARVEREGVSLTAPARFALVALDEGVEDGERVAPILSERLALHLQRLDANKPAPAIARTEIEASQARLAQFPLLSAETIEPLCAVAMAFGVASPRASLFAVRAARAAAALAGRDAPDDADMALAARLVLAPRALYAPAAPEESAPPPESGDAPAEDRERGAQDATERLIEAVTVSLPENFLEERARAHAARRAEAPARGSGEAAKSALRGAPRGARAGALRPGARLDLVATLRAAAPWQKLRRVNGKRTRIHVRKDDFRIRRFEERLESSRIFVVDASGSTAMQRLGEAKGAVEHLLAQAYVTRARVALIAFREREAELLLPPTRSLAHARRRLADLPGGGATPLAAAIDAATALAIAERAKRRTPFVVFLSDGRGNISRSGEAGRAQAEADALDAARTLRAAGVAAAFINTAPVARPEPARLAEDMGAVYKHLPSANAETMAEMVRAHTGGR